MEKILSVQHLSKAFRNFKLEDISFDLPGGTITGFVGENGAGKTTTLKCILDIMHKDGGTVTAFERDFAEYEQAIKANTGFVFDYCAFPASFTPKSISKMLSGIYPKWDEGQFFTLLERLKVPRDNTVGKMSAGMKAKLNIACAMCHGARLLILDEPTSGLDPVARDELMDMLREFVCDEEHAVLFSTHITTDLEKVADYIIFIHQGKIILNAEKDALLEQFAIWRCTENELKKLPEDKIIGCRVNKYGCEALLQRKDAPQGAVLDKCTIDDIMVFHIKGGKQ